MGVMACIAAHFNAHWLPVLIFVACALAGASANGFTGLAYAEFARIGGVHRTEATGLGSAALFSGVLLLPSLGALVVSVTGSYVIAFSALGVMAMAAALMLAVKVPSAQN